MGRHTRTHPEPQQNKTSLQEAIGDLAGAERIYAQLKEEHPTNPVRRLSVRRPFFTCATVMSSRHLYTHDRMDGRKDGLTDIPL